MSDLSDAVPKRSAMLVEVRHWIVLLLLAWGAAFLLAAYTSRILGHDQAWYLYAAQRVLAGDQLYGPQLTETNPPLIIWFSVVPAFLASVAPIPIALALHLVTLLLVLASAAWCVHLLHCAYTRLPTESPSLGKVDQLFFAAAILFLEAKLIPFDLGQREQLLVILVLPLLIAAGTHAFAFLPLWEIAAVGFAAGVGICFKPQQVLVLLVVFAPILASTPLKKLVRSPIWMAVLGAVGACLLYMVTIGLFAALYLHAVVPILANTYWAFGPYTILSLMRMQHHFFLALLLAAVLNVVGTRHGLLSPVSRVLLLAATGAWLAYGLQHAGFFYHRIPEDTFIKLAFMWMGLEMAGRSFPALVQAISPSRLQLAGTAVIFLALTASEIRRNRQKELLDSSSPLTLQGFLHMLPTGTVVWSLCTDLGTHFPEVLDNHLVWGSRFAHLWMLPALQQNEAMLHGAPRPAKVLNRETLDHLSTLQRQSSAEDLVRWRPAFVTVPLCAHTGDCQGIVTPNFDTLGWFQEDPAFAAAWQGYQLEGSLTDVHRGTSFDLYKLIGPTK